MTPEGSTGSSPPSHEGWDRLVKRHVLDNGLVSYKGFIQDLPELEAYLAILSKNPPASDWSKEEKLAYWINAYNGLDVTLCGEFDG